MSTWESLDNEREIKFSDNGNVISIRPKELKTVPIFCPVCTFRMKDAEDFVAYREYQCCQHCEIKFARTHENWKDGWRPDKTSEKWLEYVEIREQMAKARINFT